MLAKKYNTQMMVFYYVVAFGCVVTGLYLEDYTLYVVAIVSLGLAMFRKWKGKQ